MSKSQSDMSSPQNREESLFALALEQPADRREAFLGVVCAADHALRQRLEALLTAHEQGNPALDAARAASPGVKATVKIELAETPDEAVGQVIGRYKVLQKVGEGGCGAVYMAEQEQPVRRRVALKVIKLGMDTKAVIARFEAERQALALMDHPNIAKVLDAGSTDTGRPYFVMELVRGIKFTEYCDQNKLPTRERIVLFIRICQAIQHAHQKGIIHRDIKPSNILVTLHDGVPIPKVIDFGIAKATTDQRLTDKTLFTAYEQFIGTPAYMSPEQAEMSGLDIDTRSDIYSLGVLLYELLTGRTPFDPKELMESGIDAMRKTIREKEPVRPSTKVATLQGDDLTTTAARRAAEAPKLISSLRGDLDWIVMKCLEKDRTRRYETANGLAFDLKRHLDNEPVLARPPSAAYKFQKAVRRNKLVFIAGLAVAAALLLGIVVSAWQAVRARRAEALALQSRRDSEKLSNFMLDDFYTELEPSGQYETVTRLARRAVAYFDSLPALLRTPETERNRALAQAHIAQISGRQGDTKVAQPIADETVAALEQMRKRGDQSEEVIFALGLAMEARYFCYTVPGDRRSAIEALQQGAGILRPLAISVDGSHRVKLEYAKLLNLISHFEPPQKGAATCEEALHILAGAGALDLSDLSAASAWADIADSEARIALAIGRLDDAERLENQVQTLTEGVLARRPGDLQARLDLSFAPDVLALIEARRFHEAEALRSATKAREATEDYIRFNPSDLHGWVVLVQRDFDIATLLFRQGRVAEALRTALAAMQQDRASGNIGDLVPAAKDPPSLNVLRERIACWEAQRGNRGAAEQALQEARRSLEANASRNQVTEITKEVSLERLEVAERQVSLAFDEDAAVYTMATNALPRLVKLGEIENDPLITRVQVSFRKHALDEYARSALNVGRYAEAETAARALLSFPLQTELSDRSYLEQPDDPDWGRVLLAQAAVEQGRKPEALQTLEPALSNYHNAQAQGAAYIAFRQHFARALYVRALAEPADDDGKVLARESLNHAAAQLNALTDEAKQLHDSKELFSWIAAEEKKLEHRPQPQ